MTPIDRILAKLWLETWGAIGRVHYYAIGRGADLPDLEYLIEAGWRLGYYEATARDMARPRY